MIWSSFNCCTLVSSHAFLALNSNLVYIVVKLSKRVLGYKDSNFDGRVRRVAGMSLAFKGNAPIIFFLQDGMRAAGIPCG